MSDWFNTLAAGTSSRWTPVRLCGLPPHLQWVRMDGHAANTSSSPRRSIQGALIPRDGRAGTDFAAGMQPETRARLGTLARQVLAL